MSETPGGRRREDDDLPPTRSEADAVRGARALPLLWMIVGLIVAIVFALLLVGGGRFLHGRSAGPAPIKASATGVSPPSLASGAEPR